MTYTLTYIILSASGKYESTFTGNLRPISIALNDQLEWKPKLCVYNKFKSISNQMESRYNLMGLIFYPCIIIDRRFFHKTKKIENAEEIYKQIRDGRSH